VALSRSPVILATDIVSAHLPVPSRFVDSPIGEATPGEREYMAPPILVTGGCGFIGSNYVRYLLETDPEAVVVNYDRLTYAGNLQNLADLAGNPRYRFVHGDITNRDQVRAVLGDGISAVVNFAAESHVDRSIHDSGPFVHTNVLGTQVLLD